MGIFFKQIEDSNAGRPGDGQGRDMVVPVMNDGPNRRYSEEEHREDERRVRLLRRLVDFSMSLIAQSDISLEEARQVVRAIRYRAVELFPDKGATFDLIYAPRFRRLITEKYGLQ